MPVRKPVSVCTLFLTRESVLFSDLRGAIGPRICLTAPLFLQQVKRKQHHVDSSSDSHGRTAMPSWRLGPLSVLPVFCVNMTMMYTCTTPARPPRINAHLRNYWNIREHQ